MESDRRILVVVAIALAFALFPGAHGSNNTGNVTSESSNAASSESGTSATSWMDETFVSFLSGVVVALIVSISGSYVTYRVAMKTIASNLESTKKTIDGNLEGISKTIASNLENTKRTIDGNLEGINRTIDGNLKSTKLTIDLELAKMREQERQKEGDKRQQAYSKLRGLLFVVEQLTIIQGIGVMYIGYYTTKYKFSKAQSDLDKVEKWRGDVNKNILDLAKYNQTLWESIGSAELLFPEIEITDFRDTLFISAKILDPFFQSKKQEVLASDIFSETKLEEIKEKAINDIHMEVNKYIVVPLDGILSQMRKAESHESGKDLARGQGEGS